uniref:Uncharacterized protein n=1 Tax=viral metagenome TaxID=1070528 RepID=A0A6M3KBA3_9ZZZZ
MPEGTVNTGKYPSWKWLVGILITSLFLTIGIIMANTQETIKENKSAAAAATLKAETLTEGNRRRIEILNQLKLDKEQYYKDIGDIKDSIRSIDRKLDRIGK